MVAVVLFTVGAVFSVYEGIHKIINPEHISSPVVAFVVLVIAMGLESFSLRTAVHESNEVRGRNSWTGVHPPGQGAGTARHPARGHRRADRPGVRHGRGGADRDHR